MMCASVSTVLRHAQGTLFLLMVGGQALFNLRRSRETGRSLSFYMTRRSLSLYPDLAQAGGYALNRAFS